MIRRVLLAACLAGAVLFVGIGAARADDLEDYLERAAEADYAGSRVVVTVWEGRTIAEVAQIEHSGDVLMMGSAGGETVYVDGKVSAAGGAVAVASWAQAALADKYTVGATSDASRLGRTAHTVEILERGEVRARIVFDRATWAPLVTEIYDADGELFRIASMTEFTAHPRRVYEAALEAGREYDLVMRVDESSLPITVGDYRRVDVYAGSDGLTQAFYSDGLFSFSIFEVTPRQVERRFDQAETVRLAGAGYLALVRPAELWVAWVHGADAFVLVGDLPPDHLTEVLTDLPAPRQRSLLERVLGVFG